MATRKAIGVDTVQVERLRQEGRRVEGWMVLRIGRTSVTTYSAELADDGSIGSFRAEAPPADEPDASPSRWLSAEYGADSIRGSFEFHVR